VQSPLRSTFQNAPRKKEKEMSKINVQTVTDTSDRSLPIFSEIDELFDRIRVQAYTLFANRGFSAGHELEDWLEAERELCWPEAELKEDDGEFKLKVALAGFEPHEVELTATPSALIIKAAHEYEKSDSDEKVRWSEFRHSDVYRFVPLPAEVDVDKVKAEFRNGMLEVEARKSAQSSKKSKSVKISSGA
jgi:HSP20 family molecular chaperone IbpA